ncbi:class II histone deacetylase [Agrobacterium sp. NPDC090283]|uniref:class II histone deacetylase n=1 Tax=Agrobacterium sp. NPDC090283 TaxID=3363920 RepID=UPI00383ABA94
MTTGYLWHELFGWVDTGGGSMTPSDVLNGLQPISHHFAHADNKRRMHELVMVSGLGDKLIRIKARPATKEELLRAHTRDYVERIIHESTLPKGGDAGDGITSFGKGGYGICALAAGGALEMVEAVVKGNIRNGYALVNPCGHHAVSEVGMGFCVFNNVAVAAKHAQQVLGVKRIAIVDWDVHHGNGTQSIFWSDPNVLTISIHQDRNYPPNSGFHSERGGQGALNTNINIPLPPGTGDAGYLEAMDKVIVPALERFAPEIIIVASGFDASVFDPLARQMVSAEGFAEMTKRLMAAAERCCGGKLAMVQEGGYSIHYVAICGALTINALAGFEPMRDALSFVFDQQYGRLKIETHQAEAIEKAAQLVSDVPTPA